MRFLIALLLFLCVTPILSQDNTKDIIVAGIEAMYEENYETSLELLTKAKAQAEENNEIENTFLVLNNMGLNYYYLLDYGEALDYYLEAYTIAIKDLEPYHEMIVLNNIAIFYSKDEKPEKAEEYFQKAYQIAEESNDFQRQGYYAINLGQVYNELGELDKAEAYLKESLDLIKDEPNINLEAKIELANNYYLKGNYREAKNLSQDLLGQYYDVSYTEQKIRVILLLSKTYLKEGDIEKAESFANKALNENINLENKIDVYQQLASVYINNNELDKALMSKDSLLVLQAELNKIKNGKQSENNRVKFEIQNYQNELKEQEKIIEAQQKTFYTIIISAFIIILLFGWALRNSKLTIKQRKALHKRSEELHKLELEKERTDNLLLEKQLKEKETQLLLEQEQLKNEIESKNRKLSAKALFLTDRNKLINSIIKDLEDTNTEQDKSLINDHVRNLKGLLRTDNEWDSFVTHFEEVNQGFLNNLKQKHTNLNSNDIRFISYLYMNLTLKEISSILNITPEACRKRKERISKKLELKESNELYGYISSV